MKNTELIERLEEHTGIDFINNYGGEGVVIQADLNDLGIDIIDNDDGRFELYLNSDSVYFTENYRDIDAMLNTIEMALRDHE